MPRAAAARVEGVGELAAHRVDHRDAQQEARLAGGLALEHLGEQEVRHRGVGAREVGHEPGRVGMAAQGEHGEPQPGGPALGAPQQRAPVVG